MFNPSSRVSLDRLARAVEYSRWRLEPFRQHRMKLLAEFVGFHYSNSGAKSPVPLNLLQLAAQIYLRQLIPRAPRAMVGSRNPQLKPLAAGMEAWMNHASDAMGLGVSLRITVLNALFSMGIMKVGEAMTDQEVVSGTNQYVGQPFAEPVDLDDWVHDITAKRYEQGAYAGNRYRVELDWAKGNVLFDKTERDKLTAQTRFAYNERGDARSTTLSQSTMQNYDEYADHVELWDIWLPRERLVLTLPYNESIQGGFGSSKPLRVVEWQGPDAGPYHLLSFADVPNNVMPAAPLQSLQDLHDLVNVMWRKLGAQAMRQKSIVGVMGSATDDAERITKSSDGDAVRVDFPDRVRELNWGGIQQENLIAADAVKNIFVYMAGNLDTLGGLSPQAATATQDEMLNKNASAQIAEMQDRTVSFSKEVMRSLFHWWYTNPVLTYSANRQVAGMDIPIQISPQDRQQRFEDLDFDVDPYSMQHDTPQARLRNVVQTLQTLVLPALPQIMQQGGQLQWGEVLKILSKLGNMPELEEIIKMGPPPEVQGAQAMAQGNAPTAPPVTSRTNVRINRPMGTRQGQSDTMAQLLAGGGSPQQAGTMGRPTG